MSGFVKLYSSILDSSVWLEDAETRIVWFTLLAMADADGFVEASVGGLAHRARVDRAKCEEALARFGSPDPDSKDQEHEGRRLERVPSGFLLLNYAKYRTKRDPEERRRQLREAKRRQRERDRGSSRMMTDDDAVDVVDCHQMSAQAEAEADAEEEEENIRGCAGAQPAADSSIPEGKKPSASAQLATAWERLWLALFTYGKEISKSASKARLRLVRARLDAGASLDDFEAVVHGYVYKHSRPASERFDPWTNLSPETLLRASHFDEYVEQYREAKRLGKDGPFMDRAWIR